MADLNNGVTISNVIPDSLNGCRPVSVTMLFNHLGNKLLGRITLNSRSVRSNNRRIIKQRSLITTPHTGGILNNTHHTPIRGNVPVIRDADKMSGDVLWVEERVYEVLVHGLYFGAGGGDCCPRYPVLDSPSAGCLFLVIHSKRQ